MTKLRTGWVGGAVLVAFLGTFSTSGFAYQPTEEQKSACMNDTFRFCASAIPNTDRIIQCLSRHKAQMSQGCRAQFTKAGG
jgi:hypothetical protein